MGRVHPGRACALHGCLPEAVLGERVMGLRCLSLLQTEGYRIALHAASGMLVASDRVHGRCLLRAVPLNCPEVRACPACERGL